jgi:predicted MFS family arabinose efflux permease
MRLTVLQLGTAQTIAWASSYYLPAILAGPMARELGLGAPAVFAAVSLALVVSAVVGPATGAWIDRRGGRSVLALTSLLFALGLVVLAQATSVAGLIGAWIILGLAMGGGLYEAAFATLVRLHGRAARPAITGITLIAGFASTVGWPLTAWMADQWGWRGACVGWAAVHLVIGLPLNLWLPTAKPEAQADPGQAEPDASPAPADHRRIAVLLAVSFAATWFVSTAMAAHLPRILLACGVAAGPAVACAALIGPAQVAARILEFSLLRRLHPLIAARLASLAHPGGAAIMLLQGAPFAPVFAILHGAGNGILTIAKGTLPLAIFGQQGYGLRQGWLMVPARFAQAAAPVLVGLAVDAWGGGALWLTAAIGLVGCAALLMVRLHPGDM